MPNTTAIMVPLEAVRQTLTEVNTSALDIYKMTDLTPSWQQAFREGRAKDPGYNRVCALIAWLTQHHGDVLQRHIDRAGEGC